MFRSINKAGLNPAFLFEQIFLRINVMVDFTKWGIEKEYRKFDFTAVKITVMAVLIVHYR